MTKADVVAADTSPLNYLALIGESRVLGRLFREVCVPDAVMEELHHPNVPASVKDWLSAPPPWLRVQSVKHLDDTVQLGKGETEAISLALEHELKVILMDERRGRHEAQSRGLIAVGTLNIIDIADETGELDGLAALDALRRTNFRAERKLLDRLEARLSKRRV